MNRRSFFGLLAAATALMVTKPMSLFKSQPVVPKGYLLYSVYDIYDREFGKRLISKYPRYGTLKWVERTRDTKSVVVFEPLIDAGT